MNTSENDIYYIEIAGPKYSYIEVAGPEYSGAPYPPFDENAINESKFEHSVRYKEYKAYIKDNDGYVEWFSQSADDPTEQWENEVKRAFAANGLKNGSVIHVRFGSRDTGIIHEYELKI